ncbi:2-amino-4-hydroxy-6-hydroxymethyldihydropteridine pyrophosphokinase [Endozoicomonas montiporae]|uniref:2-amino-4-hydroxy-6-hydroxymethyldihydropteridine pyrophosphokinase n=2 Tax=Endozoicomonas montiporae TaxID=1027273 RepID=A0A081N1Z8_9GAMM|nr:2-amino-4-hydroxy-6-hydroxymethyldihydropteridine diphosphokinase [Endozoicomonas montiporae]AMO58577.1 2-amino-4-hydroxy-6-hydroxymethyldihydropteridine pyrophosphokinase [Endozoicomonas montiporae CL-33]KEQ12471.1 2-amino-4-hydroxy-6-hydroxymethyldihydropteridine pyrophosphokinase [Endozoicomonas montiporae]
MTRAYIALGSNLENPGLQLQRAVDEIDSSTGIQVTGCSKLYQSVPLVAEQVPEGQPDYCNAVVEVETTLQPIELLDAVQTIEKNHGRIRSVRWEPRTLDLDILLFGNETIDSERLTVPHYQMHVRNFVLCPLHDIAPTLSMPDGRSIANLLQVTGTAGLQMIADQYPWF